MADVVVVDQEADLFERSEYSPALQSVIAAIDTASVLSFDDTDDDQRQSVYDKVIGAAVSPLSDSGETRHVLFAELQSLIHSGAEGWGEDTLLVLDSLERLEDVVEDMSSDGQGETMTPYVIQFLIAPDLKPTIQLQPPFELVSNGLGPSTPIRGTAGPNSSS